jgi:hypothetical protein
MLNFIMARVLDKTATEEETKVFVDHVNEVIDRSYDAWREQYDSLSEEEERQNFIRMMRKQGCQGTTPEEAMAFLDKKYPNNVRRQNLEKRKLTLLKNG